MHYKWKTGMWAWILHRASGVALALYLPLHLYVTSSMHNPAKFNQVMAFVSQPLFKLGEIALLGAVIYHSLNGVRILLIDWFGGTKWQDKVFYVLVAIGLLAFAYGGTQFLLHALHPGVSVASTNPVNF
jgi:succinate dehydrogenase / fumarate reductase cytochrome b subunit